MKHNVLIAAAAVIVLGGAGAFVLTRDKKTNDTTSSGTSQKTNSANSAFDAVSTEGLSFVATLTTQAEGKELVSTMESDAKTGAIKYTANTGVSPVTMIYTKDAYYMCQDASTCMKYSLTQGNSAGFDPKSFQYDNSEIDNYKNTSAQLGTESCPAGTCSVWKVGAAETESKIYIDKKTRRVSQVITGAADATSKIVYEYKDVSVVVPTNAQEVPNVSIPTQ